MSPIAGFWRLDGPLGEHARLGPMELRSGDLRVAAEARVDAELILRTYEEWGESCPDRLVGDFAFVIWDGRAHKMLCARDPFGVRPLYYHYRPFELFAFGSEVTGIVALPGVRRRHVFPLPPGHVLAVGPGWARRRQYAELDQLENALPPAPERRPTIVLNFHT